MEWSWTEGFAAGLGAAAGLGLLAGGAAYAAMWPGSRIFGRALTAPRRPGELALTFDDGPNPAWTPRLLDVLASHGVKGSFFLVGRFASAQPKLVERIAAAGHLVGVHSWEHRNLARAPAKEIHEELSRTAAMLESILGRRPVYFRPPYGGRRPAVFRIARELGLKTVLWNAMTNDWAEPSADLIAARLARRVEQLKRHGHAANIVLHDGSNRDMAADRGASVAAAGQLLARLKSSHRFVRLDAWEQG